MTSLPQCMAFIRRQLLGALARRTRTAMGWCRTSSVRIMGGCHNAKRARPSSSSFLCVQRQLWDRARLRGNYTREFLDSLVPSLFTPRTWTRVFP